MIRILVKCYGDRLVNVALALVHERPVFKVITPPHPVVNDDITCKLARALRVRISCCQNNLGTRLYTVTSVCYRLSVCLCDVAWGHCTASRYQFFLHPRWRRVNNNRNVCALRYLAPVLDLVLAPRLDDVRSVFQSICVEALVVNLRAQLAAGARVFVINAHPVARPWIWDLAGQQIKEVFPALYACLVVADISPDFR